MGAEIRIMDWVLISSIPPCREDRDHELGVDIMTETMGYWNHALEVFA